MKVSCLQDRLAKGLSIVGRAVSSRSVLPVLSNILIATDKARIKLSATNLEIGINCWVGGKVEEEGTVTVPAKLLSEFVNSLPRETKIEMDLDVRTHTVNMRCGQHDARIKGIDASEFPLIPTGGEDRHISIDAGVFRRMIEQVLFAAATDESRPILTGVLTSFEGNILTMAAADGFRLAVREHEFDEPVPSQVSVIVPARALNELSRIIGMVETEDNSAIDLILGAGQSQIMFQMHSADPSVDLVSQLIEGTFPDYKAIIPPTHKTRVTLETSAFLEAVRVAYLFARDAANIIRLNIRPGSELSPGIMQVAATSAEQGDDVSELQVLVEGDPIEIAFNARYLIDVLSVIDDPEVVLETTTNSRPGMIRPKGNDHHLCVIMPMHIAR